MIEDLLYFIKERHSIYLKKEKGLSKPWTKDPILQTYKFCNVYRELDTVTKWIARNVRTPYSTNRNLWFMLCLARRINWPDTLQEIMDMGGWPVKNYDPAKLIEILDNRTKRGDKCYTGAYMITAEHVVGETKSRATALSNLLPLWEKRNIIEPQLHGRLEDAFNAILGQGFAWGSFMTAQVVADLKYVSPLNCAPDWWTWAASGPGSRRGLNRILGRNLNDQWKEVEWLKELQKLSKVVAPHIKKRGYPRLHNQDLQNCLCEYSKYAKVKDGTGRCRNRYEGTN